MGQLEDWISAFHTDASWMPRVQRYAQLDDAAFGEVIACFFRERRRDQLPVTLPAWADERNPAAFEQKRQEVCRARGWNADMPLLGIMHLEYLARDEYKRSLHLQFLTALEEIAAAAPGECRILDYGCGMSSFGQLALNHAKVHVTFADVDPETVRYLQWVAEAKWPGRTRVHPLKLLGTPYSRRARIRVDYDGIRGPYDVIVLADVLEHMLDSHRALLHFWSQVRTGGVLFVNYPYYMEGDWHTPEAFYLQPWCMRFLRRTCDAMSQKNPLAWRKRSDWRAQITRWGLTALVPALQLAAKRFARGYIRTEGTKLIEQVRTKAGRELTLDQLLQSVDA